MHTPLTKVHVVRSWSNRPIAAVYAVRLSVWSHLSTQSRRFWLIELWSTYCCSWFVAWRSSITCGSTPFRKIVRQMSSESGYSSVQRPNMSKPLRSQLNM